MTDTDKLKRLAEAIAKRPRPSVDYTLYEGYYCAADPTTILALIAERNEAVALLRELDVGTEDEIIGMSDSYLLPVVLCVGQIREIIRLLARIDATNNTVA